VCNPILVTLKLVVSVTSSSILVVAVILCLVTHAEAVGQCG